MLAVLMSLALVSAPPQDPPVQDPPPQDPPVTRVDDIIVDGRPLAVVAEEFVAAVGEAPGDRGLARWNRPMCVGVANLKREAAQPLIDHIAAVAADLGVRSGDPGCRPNVIVVFTEDPRAEAAAIAEADPAFFRLGHRNFHLSSGHREEFLTSDAPVRWWATSMPIDAETGGRAVRIAGDVSASTGQPEAPVLNTTYASRLITQIHDDMAHVIVIVDIARVQDVSPQQLADYLAFVALAQIDPRGDTSRQASVLNAFDDPSSSPGFSDWDLAYLRALYRPGPPMRTDRRAVADGVANDVARTIRSGEPQ